MKKWLFLIAIFIIGGFIVAQEQTNDDFYGRNSLFAKNEDSHRANIKKNIDNINRSQSFLKPTFVELISSDEQVFHDKYTYDSKGKVLTCLSLKATNGGAVNDFQFTYTYDENEKVISILEENWNGSAFVFYSLTEYTYTSFGEVETEFYERPVHHWKYRYSYTYNEQLKMATKLDESYDWSTAWWENFSKYTYSYDIYGNLEYEMFERWINNQWNNIGRIVNAFDSRGNKVSMLKEGWYMDHWLAEERFFYSFNQDNNIIATYKEYFRLNVWQKSFLDTLTYDQAGGALSERRKHWLDNQWKDFYATFYNNDASGNHLYMLNQYLNLYWRNVYQCNYYYDDSGNCIFAKSERFSWEWYPDNKMHALYFNNRKDHLEYDAYKINVQYDFFTKVDDEITADKNFELLQNYPNPFNPTTKIVYALPLKSNVSLKVYDVIGNEIAELVQGEQEAGKYTVNFNGANISSGVYFYKLTAANFVETKKMILIK